MEQSGGTVKQCLWNSVVEQWNIVGATVWWNSVGGTVEHRKWNSVVEQWNCDGGTVFGGTVMVEQ